MRPPAVCGLFAAGWRIHASTILGYAVRRQQWNEVDTMRKWVWAAAWWAFSGAVLAGLPPPKVAKISERVYALLCPVGMPDKNNGGYMNNSVVIVGDNGVILVDTGFNDEIGAHIKQAVGKITPKPVTHVINTHHHGDHTLGNVVFSGARFISAEKCKELLETTGYDWIRIIETVLARKFPDTRPVSASVTYGDGRADTVIDGVKLTFWVPSGSHTPGDMMVLLPDEGVLIAGDIVVEHMAPSFRDAHVKSWIGSLAEIEKVDVKVIVPGHGKLTDTKHVGAMRARMQKLYDGVAAGYKQGLTDSETRKTLDLREWEKLAGFEELMGGAVNRTYLEIEQDNF
jgi:glyoxylase-like metal-dependent hydrolase (beta-lactamase superfamily II)